MRIIRKQTATEDTLRVTTARGTVLVDRAECTPQQWADAIARVTEALFDYWRSQR